MKSPMKTFITAFVIGLMIGSIGASEAATKAKKQKRSRGASRSSFLGDAMRPKKSHTFEGHSVEALKPGNYDSVTHLSEGDGNKGDRHLYDLPKNFAKRTAEDQSELRYRP